MFSLYLLLFFLAILVLSFLVRKFVLLRNILFTTASVVIGLFFIEAGLTISERFADSTNHKVVVGWKNEDYQKVFSFDKHNKSYLLTEVRNYPHIHDLGEYNYLINTSPCLGLNVRGSCDARATDWHFGDSFTFGFGVDNQETFVSLINRHHASINFGVPGFNPIQEIDRAIELVNNSLHKPERIWIHLFLGNDLSESVAYLDVKNVQGKPLVSSWFSVIQHRSLLYKRLANIRMNVLALKQPSGYYWVPRHFEDISPSFWQSNGASVMREVDERLRLLRQSFRGDIIFAIIPPKEVCLQRSENSLNDIQASFQIFNKKYGVKTLDFYGETSCPSVLDGFYRTDTHFNTVGHANYAKFLLKNVPNIR